MAKERKDAAVSEMDLSSNLSLIWQRRIQVFGKLLTTNIRPLKIIQKMRLTTSSDAALEEIMALDREDRCIDAAGKFLQYLLSHQDISPDDHASRWSLFNDALKEEYPHLHEIVQDECEVDSLDLQKNLVNFFMEEICRSVDPERILPELVSRRLLGHLECENLCRIKENKGPTLAAIYMVSHLHRSSNKTWYHDFLEVLMEKGYDVLVKHLDDVEHSKLAARIGTRSRRDAEELPALTVSGEAHQRRSANYAAAPTNNEEKTDERSQAMTDEQKLSFRQQPMPESAVLVSCLSKMPFDDSIDDWVLTKPMQEGWTPNDMPANVICSHPGAAGKDGNRCNWLEDKDVGSKLIEDSEAIDNSNAEVDSLHVEENMEEKQQDTLQLRDYQQELARLAVSGHNVIICAPTGSGKTHVALKIMDEHLKQQNQGMRKVVFLVNQQTLADQQYNMCAKHLKDFRCKQLTGNTGDMEKVPLKLLLRTTDILVMTAQILLDALDQKEIDGISQFSLIVFDECHHANHRHPFNCIMHHYLDLKFKSDEDRPSKLPQIVGLTASVGVGKASRQDQAQLHIRRLCAHLDSRFICTVTTHTAQLALHTNDPTYEQFICTARNNDNFLKKLEEMMNIVEQTISRHQYTVIACNSSKDLAAKLNPPRIRGSIQYNGWASQLRKDVAKIREPDARRFLESCRRMLEFYNTSLIINDECDTEDALKYICKQIDIIYTNLGDRPAEIDNLLKDLFDKNKPYLDAVSRVQANTNPKLTKLEQLLLRAFREEPESRAIVFVKTRDLATALQQWMMRRDELKKLKPGKMVGAGPSVESGGMTKNQQVDVMTYFREGEHKIMVATSVAEEGLDIRKCNLVIRYNHVTNEIAMVQARGRARAENSRFVTLAGDDKGVREKEEINFIREMMMRDAIKGLQREMADRPVEFRQSLEKIQHEEKTTRDTEATQRNGRPKRHGEIEFRCRKCDDYACMSSDIRKVENMHHVVIDPEFLQCVIEKPDPKPEKSSVLSGSATVKGQLLCKSCGEKWGRTLLFKNVKFPVIKVAGFVLTDEYERTDAPKKWSQTSFVIEPLKNEEIQEYRRQASTFGFSED